MLYRHYDSKGVWVGDVVGYSYEEAVKMFSIGFEGYDPKGQIMIVEDDGHEVECGKAYLDNVVPESVLIFDLPPGLFPLPRNKKYKPGWLYFIKLIFLYGIAITEILVLSGDGSILWLIPSLFLILTLIYIVGFHDD